jgi:6-phosphofructokinase
MSAWAKERFLKLPDFIRKQLFIRDDSNELAVSQIETEKLLAYLVGKKLAELKKEGQYKGSFSSVCHFLGYQGRCAMPSPFDRNVAFTYGRISRILIEKGLSGYCSSARGLVEPAANWFPLAIPISHICQLKEKSILVPMQVNTESISLSWTLRTST